MVLITSFQKRLRALFRLCWLIKISGHVGLIIGFYHHVCFDEDVAMALENDLPKTHILVLEMTLMEGFWLAEI